MGNLGPALLATLGAIFVQLRHAALAGDWHQAMHAQLGRFLGHKVLLVALQQPTVQRQLSRYRRRMQRGLALQLGLAGVDATDRGFTQATLAIQQHHRIAYAQSQHAR